MTKELQKPITVFVGFQIDTDIDEQVRLYAYLNKLSVSKAYRVLVKAGMRDVPTKQEAMNGIVERLKLEWKMSTYDNPKMTKRSFLMSRDMKMKGKLPEEIVTQIMTQLKDNFDFAR
jgi:hypothetical protein